MLIQAGADLNLQSEVLSVYQQKIAGDIVARHVDIAFGGGCVVQSGCTALMRASERGHTDAVRVLLGAGADIEICRKVSAVDCKRS
jgi:ankyrin repeat protein